MWPIILIAAGCALLLESDSPSPRPPNDPPREVPPPPAAPPPPPAASGSSMPRGVNPALFRPTPPTLGPANFPTTEQAQSELSTLFQRAYALNPQGSFIVTSQTDADALRQRLNDLKDIAFCDPRAAEAYDQRGITKYVYLTLPSLRPEQRGLLYRLDRGETSAAEAVRTLDQAELQFVNDFDGRGNPLTNAFYEGHRQLGFAMRELLSPEDFAHAATQSARAIVDGPDLLNRYDGEMRAKFLLRSAPPEELRAVSRYLSENMANLDQVFWTNPAPAQMPALLRDIRAVLRNQSATDLRQTALQMTTYISFVLTVQGTTSLERDMIDECRTEFRLTEESSCSLRASLRLAAESPDDFDNAHMRHQLSEHLARFYANYLSLSPADRVSQQGLLLEGELGTALMGGQFGAPFSATDLQPILNDVRTQLNATHIPASRGIPLTWEEIYGIRDTPIEVRVDDLPSDIQSLAQRIPVHVPRSRNQGGFWDGTLLDYLRQNVDVVVLTRRAPYLSDDIGEPEATANRLFKTVILDIDGPRSTEAGDSDKQAFEILSTLAHEAYHNDYFHNMVPYDSQLLRSSTLNERNAHLFEANVIQQILTLDIADFRPLLERAQQGTEAIRMMSDDDQQRLRRFNREFERGPQLYATHRLTGLAANVPLNYQLTEEGLWPWVLSGTSVSSLGQYPTAFVNDYLRMRHLTAEQFNTQVQQQLMRSLGLRSGPASGSTGTGATGNASGAGGSAGRRHHPTRLR